MTPRLAANNERGIALLTTMLAVMLLTAIGMAMMFGSSMETMINANYRDKQSALYASVSGAQEARDRIQPVNVVGKITAPVLPPALGANNVIYIVNPTGGDVVEPWNLTNQYFDNELCQENVLGLTGTPGVSCTSIPNGSWYTAHDNSQASAAPWNLVTPLATKWTRIMLKTNNMGVVPVNTISTDATQVCWDGKQQVTLPANYMGTTCGPNHKVLTVVVTNPGNGYTVQPLITIDAPDSGGTQATATTKWQAAGSGEIVSILVAPTEGGSGYTTVPTVSIVGGGGAGATAVAEIVPPGAPVQSLTLTSPGGQCFASAPSVSISGGGLGSGATGVATVNSGPDCIYSIAVGASCASNDTVTFTVTGGGGSGFSASSYKTAKGGQNQTFSGLGLSIVNPGTGYNGTPITVTATGGKKTCTGVTATPSFGRFVSGLTLATPGADYQQAPSVSLGGGVGSPGLAAVAVATLGPPATGSGRVVRVNLTNAGSGYTTPPTVTFSGGGGTGAQATAQINQSKILVGPQTLTNSGSGYSAVPKVTITRGAGDTTGLGAEAYATVDGVSGLTFGMVYQLTSLAVTRSGARAMTQMEVATPVRGMALTGALTLAGPQPVVDTLPSSNNFFVDGTDSSDGSRGAPVPPGCNITPNTAHPAVGAYDDPNASTMPIQSSVDLVKNKIPSGRTNNYKGSGPSPDVQNVYGSLGDTLTSPTGLLALTDAIKSGAGANLFPDNYDMDHKGPMGTASAPIINFVDGDLTLQGNTSGFGILVVTGALHLGGNFSWNGLVLVIGEGKLTFSGGGNGQINGQVFVSKIWDDNTTKDLLTEVGSPELSWNGGGGNGIFYNHCWADDMLTKFPFLPPQSTKQLKVLSTRTVTY